MSRCGPLPAVLWCRLTPGPLQSRRLQLEVSAEELAQRQREWTAPPPLATRGYTKLYIDNVNQADEGCDFGFLVGGSGAYVPRENH
jgi:dihydroxy-acid dehydratase